MDKLWLKRDEALTLTSMRDKAFRANVQTALGPEDVRQTTGRGQPLEFWAPAIVKRLVTVAGDSAGVDPLMAGGPDSSALERFREARADREELELSVRRGQLIDVEKYLIWWHAEMAPTIRRCVEKLQKKYGNDAAKIVAVGLRQTNAAVEESFE